MATGQGGDRRIEEYSRLGTKENLTMNNATTRRSLLIAASLGGVAATSGIAAFAEGPASLGQQERRHLHLKLLQRLIQLTGDYRQPSPKIMSDALDELRETQIITDDEARTLKGLVYQLFADEDDDLQKLLGEAEKTAMETASWIGDTAGFILESIRSGVEFAIEVFGTESGDGTALRTVIARGVMGALLGARVGSGLGPWGTLAGGVAGWIIAYDDARGD